jgi:hypothetical protein
MDPFDPSTPLTRRIFTLPAALAGTIGVLAVVEYGMWFVAPESRWRMWTPLVGFMLMAIPNIAHEIRVRSRKATWRGL